MNREGGAERGGTQRMCHSHSKGRMDLCSMGNNWPWCFNSRVRNLLLLKSIKRINIIVCFRFLYSFQHNTKENTFLHRKIVLTILSVLDYNFNIYLHTPHLHFKSIHVV